MPRSCGILRHSIYIPPRRDCGRIRLAQATGQPPQLLPRGRRRSGREGAAGLRVARWRGVGDMGEAIDCWGRWTHSMERCVADKASI